MLNRFEWNYTSSLSVTDSVRSKEAMHVGLGFLYCSCRVRCPRKKFLLLGELMCFIFVIKFYCDVMNCTV